MADELMGDASAGEMTGGESTSPAPVEAVEPTPAETAAPRDGAPSGSDLDDEDDDVYDEESLVQDREKLRRLIKNRRRDGRFAKENRSLVARIRDSKLDLDDLVVKARNHDALVERINRDPEFAQRLFTKGQTPSRPSSDAPAAATYPGLGLAHPSEVFDMSDRAAQHFGHVQQRFEEFHKQSWEFQEQARSVISALSREVAALRDGIHGEKTQATTKAWSQAIDAAVGQYDDAIAPYLKDSLVGLYHAARGKNREDILKDPAAAIRQYIKDESLGKFRKATAAKAGTTAATQQRMAEANRARPGASAFTGGQPAGAKPKERLTVHDVTRRLQQQA